MRIELESGNPEVKSVIIHDETERDLRLILKDCDESITWRFKTTSKENIHNSIRKAERIILAVEHLHQQLIDKL